MTSPTGLLEIDALVDVDYLQDLIPGSTTLITTGFVPGTPAIYTYGFPTPSAAEAAAGYRAFSSLDAAMVREALGLYARIAGLKFVEMNTAPASAQIGFEMDANFVAHYGNWGGITVGSGTGASDIYLPAGMYQEASAWNGMEPGGAGFLALLHEIGHALGLKHPGNYGYATPPFLPAAEDDTQYTVMSYHTGQTYQVQTGNTIYTYPRYPVQPMSLDIGALDYLYGGAVADTAAYACRPQWSDVANGFVGTDCNDMIDVLLSELDHQWPGSSYKQSDGTYHYQYSRHAIDGGSGRDMLKVDAPLQAASIRAGLANTYELKVSLAYQPGSTGYDWAVDVDEVLTSVERLQFSDAKIALDIAGDKNACYDTGGPANPGQVYRLYQAMFGRTPDKAGLAYWIGRADAGDPLTTIATSFATGAEFSNKYGSLSDHAFVDQLYQNVLHRAGDPAGAAYWYGELDAHVMMREQVLVGFSESVENQDAVIGVIQNGIDYTT